MHVRWILLILVPAYSAVLIDLTHILFIETPMNACSNAQTSSIEPYEADIGRIHIPIPPTRQPGDFDTTVTECIGKATTPSPSTRPRSLQHRAAGTSLLCPALDVETWKDLTTSITTPSFNTTTIESIPSTSTPAFDASLDYRSSNESIPDLTEEIPRHSLERIYIGPYSIIYKGQRGAQKVIIFSLARQ